MNVKDKEKKNNTQKKMSRLKKTHILAIKRLGERLLACIVA